MDVIPVSTTTQSAIVLSPVRSTAVHGSVTTVIMTEPRHGVSPFNPNRPLFPGGPGSSFFPHLYGINYSMMVGLPSNPATYTKNTVATRNQGN